MMKKTVLFVAFVVMLCSLICILPVAAQPLVILTDPENGATGVLGNPEITVTFSESISSDSSKPLTGTITINDGSNDLTFGYAYAYGTTLKFGNYTGPWLAPDTTYTVTIQGFTGPDGTPMTPCIWSFRTGPDTTPPTVIATDPVVNAVKVPVDIDAITLTFSEPIVYAPAYPSDEVTLTEPYGSGGNHPKGIVTVVGNTMTIPNPGTPDPWLHNWEFYYVTVMGRGVKDVAGNELVDDNLNYYRYHFETVSTDTTPPLVISTNPADGATGVPLDVTITATFDQSINRCVGSVELRDHTGYLVESSETWTAPDQIHLAFKPTNPLIDGETYTVTLHGIIDSYLNVMPDYSWTFSTAKPPITKIATHDSFSNYPRCGWYNTSVEVTLSATDQSGSGIQKTEYRLDGGSWITYSGTFAIDTEGITTVDYRSTDNNGNTEEFQSLTIKIDKTPPTITAVVIDPITGNPLSPNANGWYSSDVTVRFTIRDELSGLHVGIPGEDHITDVTKCTEGANQVVTLTIEDMPGSPATATLSVNIDKTAPLVTISVPVNCAHYIFNENVIADWSATDSLSGIAAQSGTVPTGAAIDTATTGMKQFMVTATDNAGIENTKTIHYTVDSPAEANKALTQKVDDLGLKADIEEGLLAKLAEVQNLIEQGKNKPARNTLNAFISQVKAQTGKAISPDQAADLIGTAQRIIASIPGK